MVGWKQTRDIILARVCLSVPACFCFVQIFKAESKKSIWENSPVNVNSRSRMIAVPRQSSPTVNSKSDGEPTKRICGEKKYIPSVYGGLTQLILCKLRNRSTEDSRVFQPTGPAPCLPYKHQRTGSEIRETSPLNSKSDGISSPTELGSIRGLQRALESLI